MARLKRRVALKIKNYNKIAIQKNLCLNKQIKNNKKINIY